VQPGKVVIAPHCKVQPTDVAKDVLCFNSDLRAYVASL